MRLATGAEGTEILTAFYERSKEITNSSVVDKKYAELATDMQETYLLALAAVNPRALWMRVLNRLTGQRFTKWMLSLRYGKRKLLRILNVIECEAHNELLCQGIKDMLD